MDGSSGTAITRSWYRYITVEPAMFLYMFAFMLTTVIEQELFVMKTCLANLNYTHEICDNLKDKKYEEYKNNVQVRRIEKKLFKFIEFIYCETNLITVDACVNISPMESHCWLYFSSHNCIFHWFVVGQAGPKDSTADWINREINLRSGVAFEYPLW